MQVTRDFPICSIPYIDLKVQPERFEENEINKKDYGWQEGDGYFFDADDDVDTYFKNASGLQPRELCKKYTLLCTLFRKDVNLQKIQDCITQVGMQLFKIDDCINGTILMHFVKRNNAFLVKTCLQLNVDPSLAAKEAYTPLWKAIEEKRKYDVLNKSINKDGTGSHLNFTDYKNFHENDRIIVLLWMHHAIIHPKLSDESLLVYDSFKLHFFKDISKELYVGNLDEASHISMLLPEIIHYINLIQLNLFITEEFLKKTGKKSLNSIKDMALSNIWKPLE